MVSIFVLLATYLVGNTSFPLPDEMAVLQAWDKFKTFNNNNADSIPNEVLLINVCYDKQLVDYEEDGIPVGQYVITDRRKLLDFLTIARKADNYKYIMLDVIFEKGIASPQDSALFNLIASMERIVIPVHHDVPLQDSLLYTKAASADYTVTWKDTNFARFKFLRSDRPSMPLKMYEDINGGYIHKHGLLYTSNNWLCKNGITLKLPIKLSSEHEESGSMMKYNTYHLGADLLDLVSIAPVADDIDGKIVVIGDFKNDIHDTYAGPQPGSLICLNAYYALVRGDHVLRGEYGGVLLFCIFIAIVYFIVSLACLHGFTLAAVTSNPWLKIVLSFATTNLLFWSIAILAYILPLNYVYVVWIPIAVFSLIDFFVNIYSCYKETQYEKTKSQVPSDASATDDGNPCRQLSDPVSEQPANTGEREASESGQ